MRIFISAGEASGDLHAAALTREILSLAPDAEVFGAPVCWRRGYF